MYNAFAKGDVATILDRCTDDVDSATDASGDIAPSWGERKGKEAVTGFFTGIAGAAEVTEFTVLSLAANETDVMVFLRYGSRNTATGEDVDAPAPLLALLRRQGGVLPGLGGHPAHGVDVRAVSGEC